MHKYLKLILLIVAALALVSKLHTPVNNYEHKEIKIVEVEAVRLGDIEKTEEFIAIVTAKKRTHLRAKSSGILRIIAQPGTYVEAKALLADIENPAIQETYALLKQSEEIAKLQYDRALQLMSSGVSNKSAIEEKKRNWIEAQNKLADVRNAIENKNIRAPFNGIVGMFNVNDNSEINSGDLIVDFYDPTNLMLEFGVPIEIATNFCGTMDVFVNKEIYQLTSVSKLLDPDTGMCKAMVDIKCKDCIIGSTMNLELVLLRQKSVIIIPTEAMFLKDRKYYVYIVVDDKAVLTQVEPGIRQKNFVEITSGLKLGDVLIIRGTDRLHDNSPVQIMETPVAKNTPYFAYCGKL